MFLLILALVDFSLILGIWLAAAVRTGTSLNRTFSYMLVHDSVLFGQYIGWLSYHGVVLIAFGAKAAMDYKSAVSSHASPDPNDRDIMHCCGRMTDATRHLISAFMTAIFLSFSLLSECGFIQVAIFPTNTMSIPHAIWAGTAFISVLIAQLALLVKRMVLCTYKKGYATWLSVFVFNIMFVIAIFVLLILFVVIDTGQLEFALMLCMSVCYAFQLFDFIHQINCPRMHAEHTKATTVIGVNLKRSYLHPTEYKKNMVVPYDEKNI
jgi:hypothetical protein